MYLAQLTIQLVRRDDTMSNCRYLIIRVNMAYRECPVASLDVSWYGIKFLYLEPEFKERVDKFLGEGFNYPVGTPGAKFNCSPKDSPFKKVNALISYLIDLGYVDQVQANILED